MAEGTNSNPNRKMEDRGTSSPGSKESQQQAMSGNRGAEAGQTAGAGHQPPQGSNRSPAQRNTQAPDTNTHFAPGHAPSEQGEKDHPSPHVIAQHQQGQKPRSGSHVEGDRSEEAAQGGAPAGEHAEHSRHGRQNVGGNRPEHRGED